jgi:predicted nucleotidyltransferase
MSVLGHLTSTADNIKILDTERSRINTSINHILANMNSYFSNVDDKFVFGSYDRKTILKRSVDYNSDIDLMVVFNDGNYYTPQTLMNKGKRAKI